VAGTADDMTTAKENRRPPIFAILSCVLCAITIGYLIWNTTLRSDAEPDRSDYLFLFVYVGLSLTSYLAALWFLNRYARLLSAEAIPSLFFVSVFGTTIPYIASAFQIWRQHTLQFDWYVRASVNAWLLLTVVMIAMMAVVAGLGFLCTWLNGRIASERRAHGAAGS
jgi:hypothetical protein